MCGGLKRLPVPYHCADYIFRSFGINEPIRGCFENTVWSARRREQCCCAWTYSFILILVYSCRLWVLASKESPFRARLYRLPKRLTSTKYTYFARSRKYFITHKPNDMWPVWGSNLRSLDLSQIAKSYVLPPDKSGSKQISVRVLLPKKSFTSLKGQLYRSSSLTRKC